MPQLILNDGAEIDYEDMGLGYPVIFIHGWGMSKDAFWPQAALAEKCRVIIPSLRGCGRSTNGQKPLTIKTIGEDIFEFAALLDLREYIIVGWSMGALAVWYSANDVDKAAISKFVSIDMSPKIINSKNWDLGIKGSKDLIGDIGQAHLEKVLANMQTDWASAARRMAEKIPATNTNGVLQNQIIENLVKIAIDNKPENMSNLWRDMVGIDARENLGEFTPETYLVRGMQSALYSHGVGEYAAAKLPFAVLVDFQNSGHSPHLEEAGEFNSLILSLIDDASGINKASDFLTEGVSLDRNI